MSAVNPEFRDLQQQVAELRDRMSKAEGRIEQVSRIAFNAGRQTIWQFVIFTVTMAGVLAGTTIFQTEALRREMNVRFEKVDQRFEALEKRMDERFEAMEKRMDQMEKNLTARFDDLKEIVLSDRKQTTRPNSRKKK
jgi:hypothetical protein